MLGVTLDIGAAGDGTLGSGNWVGKTSVLMCVTNVGAGDAYGGVEVDAAFGGTGGDHVCWWKMSANCCRWARWLSGTGQSNDDGDG
jgi:hypothetical protein